MHYLYVDESGDGETLRAHSPMNTAPVFVLLGVLVPVDCIQRLTVDYLKVKRQFFPGKLPSPHFLDAVLAEVKGSELRKQLRSGRRGVQRQTLGFIDHSLRVLEEVDARVVGRVYVKKLDDPCDGRAMYTFAVQDLHQHLQHFLSVVDSKSVLHLRQPDQGEEHAHLTLDLHCQVQRRRGQIQPDPGDAHLRAQRQPRGDPARRRSRFRLCLPSRDPDLRRGPRQCGLPHVVQGP